MVLAVLSANAVFDSFHQTRIVRDLATTGSDTDSYQQAAYLAAVEMSMIQASLREPDGEEREQLLAVDRQAQTAMTHMAATDPQHRLRAGYLAQRHLNLRPELALYLSRLDRDDLSGAQRSLEDVIEPSFQTIMNGLLTEQDQHVGEYARLQGSAQRESLRAQRGNLFVFGVGLLVFVLLGWSARAHRRQVETMMATDSLTGLPNRAAFAARTRHALARDSRQRHRVASPPLQPATVLVLNLDGFRDVNDQLGERVGDHLLAEVSRRLVAATRAQDLVARIGGDEFAILLIDADPHIGEAIAARLRDAFDQPFLVDDLTIDLEVSIGGAAAEPGNDVTVVLRNADSAMHDAKRQRAGFRQFRPERHHDTAARLSLLGDLRRALDNPDQFTLHYQPKIDINSGVVTGVEALARWQHPGKGPIPPAQFIPVLETTALIHRFTDRVLTLALQQARHWLDAGHRIAVAVNISTRSLIDASFPDRLAALLHEFNVPGELLCIEVTEHTVMTDPDTTIEALHRLRALGVKTSLDDYGTGYSSMTYLKLLPVDELKVDRSFVSDMVTDPSSHALVASTIELGHNLGLVVVAEGVEDATTQAALQALGCDTAQGYFYARPQPADALAFAEPTAHAGL